MHTVKRKETKRKPEDKMRIVLKGLEPGIDVASLCRQEGVIPTQYYTWEKQQTGPRECVGAYAGGYVDPMICTTVGPLADAPFPRRNEMGSFSCDIGRCRL
jgi:hypothetical protein